MTIRKILQIIPATGWYAIYKDGDDKYQVPVACWTLWEDASLNRHVSGLNASNSVDVCESIADFAGYTTAAQPHPRAQDAVSAHARYPAAVVWAAFLFVLVCWPWMLYSGIVWSRRRAQAERLLDR